MAEISEMLRATDEAFRSATVRVEECVWGSVNEAMDGRLRSTGGIIAGQVRFRSWETTERLFGRSPGQYVVVESKKATQLIRSIRDVGTIEAEPCGQLDPQSLVVQSVSVLIGSSSLIAGKLP